jgi:hypothetical protein
MNLRTVAQFAALHPAFTVGGLRNMIFKATPRHSTNGTVGGNGLTEAGAILRIGRKVLINEERFFDWIARNAFGMREGVTHVA